MTSVVGKEVQTANVDQKNIECSEIIVAAQPSDKLLESRTSISSVDSSISLSYDAAPFTPRHSLTISSSTDDEHPRLHSSSAAENSSSSDAALSGPESTSKKSSVEPENDENEEPFDPPDEELTKRIVDQVEYYFSDENIVKDAFLLKHVRRNKEGYVSLKLIASFKRIKHIARDWRVVREALKKSTKLQINEAATKLRRKDPLPLYDQTTPSRTVVAINIPSHKATIESIAEMFRGCGEIALVRILRPGNPIPADVRPFYNKHPEMQQSVCALVEFVRTESAHNALNRETDANSSVQVLELNAPPAKKKLQGKKFLNKNSESEFSSSCQSGSETEDRHKLRLQARRSSTQLPDHWHQRRWSRDSGTDSSGSSFCRSRSNSGVYFMPEPRRLSSGWDSSSDSYSSCRSRSNSGASVPEIFQMRRYSHPRKDSNCCCCGGYTKCEESLASRRYSLGRSSDDGAGYNPRPVSRCASGESCDGPYRRESIPEFYSVHGGASFERRSSLPRPVDGQWCRSNSLTNTGDQVRRLSDSSDGRVGLMRQRSFGSGVPGLPGSSDSVVRLPRGPDGGRGFQRELIEYALAE